MIVWVRRHYGAGPLHLLGHVVAFVIAAWAIAQILGGRGIINWIAWFIGAALLHDMVALPIYSTLDRALGVASARSRPHGDRPPWINHLRVPAAIAGVLLVVYFPLILGKSSRNYLNDTGHPLAGYTRNWLLITAGLFAASLIVYVARTVIRRGHRSPPVPRTSTRVPQSSPRVPQSSPRVPESSPRVPPSSPPVPPSSPPVPGSSPQVPPSSPPA